MNTMTLENNTLHLILNGNEQRIVLKPVNQDAKVTVWSVPTDYRAEGVFIALTEQGQPEEIPACNLSDCTMLGTLDLAANPATQLIAMRDARKANAVVDTDKQLAALAAGYPEREISSWPQQIKEAEALSLNPEAETPLLSAMVAARDITREILASRILRNAAAYSEGAGQILGIRHHIDDLLDAATTLDELRAVPTVHALLSLSSAAL